ncbi:NAD(P)/FAD-dependent oxidoreductase [Dactylosporangium sp. CA-092794]|uniref:NAD(P)/FAD-dependent oxidoreductase n=1 Tax=Dactylosporangium sp. CA-092794 TaxID=3239929 RepID=UPI003D90412D
MSPRSVVVVGASLAGLSTARALRQQGFDGPVTIIGAEPWRPYDRPPLSKAYLAGAVDRASLDLSPPEEELELRWRLGVPAVALDPPAGAVRLADGSKVRGDAVVIATGAAARKLPGAARLRGVHTLRTVDDAEAVRARLLPGVRLVVVGAGFIGAEVASTAAALGAEVTVVELQPVPLGGVLGVPLGRELARLYAAHGVALLTGVGVAEVRQRAGRVDAVVLTDSRVLPAEVVVVGIGARPAVDWLAGSGLRIDDGVRCDAAMRTVLPNVFAVGDCARPEHGWTGEPTRLEHWTAAIEQPVVAVSALLRGDAAGTPEDGYRAVPYFWSDQFGVRLQFAGHLRGGEHVRAVSAEPLVAVYERLGEPVAVLAIDHPRLFGRWRRLLVP